MMMTRLDSAWIASAVIVFLAIVCSGSIAFAQGIYNVNLDEALKQTPKSEWVARFNAAKAVQSDFKVESVDEFIRINLYYEALTKDGMVVHSFVLENGGQIRCIDVKSQAAITAAGLDPENLLLEPVQPPVETTKATPQPTDNNVHFGLDGSDDAQGNIRKCPEGSFPKLIRPIQNYYRFRTLDKIFRKYPDRTSPPPLKPSGAKVNHEYGIVYKYQDNTGLQADFNLWSPFVSANEFSLGQLWIARGEGNDVQTAEAGWQVYPYFYGNAKPNLFIFYTTQNYNDGCYNLDCGGFIQTDNSVVIGGVLDNESEIGGEQVDLTIGFIRDGSGGNHWWLKIGNKWVGYYPNSLYDNAGIAQKCELANFGGEIIDSLAGGNHTKTEMGSGRFPADGLGYAAYIRKIDYVDMNGVQGGVGAMQTASTIPTCWKCGIVNYDSDPNWGTNFFFGGSCENYEPDDDDDATDDDDTDDDEIDDDDSNECTEIVARIYEDCNFRLKEGDSSLTSEKARQYCIDGNGPWDCISDCKESDKVTTCSEFEQCLDEKCNVSVDDYSDSDNSDDADYIDVNDNDDSQSKCCG